MVSPRHRWLLLLPDTGCATAAPHGVVQALQEELRPALRDGMHAALALNASCERRPRGPRGPRARAPDGAGCAARELLRALAFAVETRARREANQSLQVSPDEWAALRPSRRERVAALRRLVRGWLVRHGRCGRAERWVLLGAETWGAGDGAGEAEGGARLLPVGHWTPAAGAAFEDDLFPHEARGFRGRTLSILTFHDPPWQSISYNESDGKRDFHGVVTHVLDALAKNLNFTYMLYFPGEGGRSLSNDSSQPVVPLDDEWEDQSLARIPWKAIVKEVRTHKVFMGAGAFPVVHRAGVGGGSVRYTRPLGCAGYTLLTARPRELGRAALFLYPFTADE
ncbi:Ionotropic receptor 93a [Gryllus bimaculatus]|nr:Ionotropic receptor 93a [Gryllus bimaculatus]